MLTIFLWFTPKFHELGANLTKIELSWKTRLLHKQAVLGNTKPLVLLFYLVVHNHVTWELYTFDEKEAWLISLAYY